MGGAQRTHGVEVGAVLPAVHQVVLAVDARPVDAHIGRLAQSAGDSAWGRKRGRGEREGWRQEWVCG